MKAWVLHGIGDMRYEEVPVPQLKTGEALVKVRRAGICSSDVPRAFVSGAYHYPIIIGHEFMGTVEDVFDGENAMWRGKRVGVFPLIPCYKCESCLRGEYETCRSYGYIGSRQDGAFAEYVAVPVWNLMELPDTVSDEAAAMLEPASVALHAVRRLDLSRVNVAAVIGNGAIGRIVARWLEFFGVKDVKLVGRGDELPLDADACVEAAGSAVALGRCIEAAKPGGQVVLVGNPSVDFRLEQKDYWQVLRKQLAVYGSWNSRYPDDWQFALENIGELRLEELVTRVLPLDELDSALRDMYNRKMRFCKIMVDCKL